MNRVGPDCTDGAKPPASGADQGIGPSIVELIGMGIAAGAFVAAGVGGGYWIGQATGGGVTIAFVGLGVGVVLALLTTYLRIRRYL